ncbi:MAG: hypothetical protein R3B84_16850 [Zavarzinella sp.]
MANLVSPEWLTARDGGLAPGLNERTVLVTFHGHPQYRLVAAPAKGTFTCVITQMNNGKRLDLGKQYDSLQLALTKGLDELRERLGW